MVIVIIAMIINTIVIINYLVLIVKSNHDGHHQCEYCPSITITESFIHHPSSKKALKRTLAMDQDWIDWSSSQNKHYISISGSDFRTPLCWLIFESNILAESSGSEEDVHCLLGPTFGWGCDFEQQLDVYNRLYLGGGFKSFLFSPLFGEDFQFD